MNAQASAAVSYAPTQAPTYSSTMQSSQPLPYQAARGPALDLGSFSKTTAFNAGPRRDPLSRQLHVQAIAEQGRSGLKRGPAYLSNTFGAGVSVPAQWPYSWETDINLHSRHQGLQPARGASDLFTSGAAGSSHPCCGILGSGSSPQASHHYAKLSAGATEEESRLLLLTNERHRRHAERRYAPTDTLGLMRPRPHPAHAQTPAPMQGAPTPNAPARHR